MNRIVIKVGSNVLTRDDGTLDVTRMSNIVDQIIRLRKSGFEVILVSSGAVACGRSLLKTSTRLHLDAVQQRQLYSAVGQVRLMDHYYQLFREYGVSVGQILTMKESFGTRREYLNQRNCIEVMLRSGVVPVVNENDTVSVTELMFTDNDELSGLVASMMDAHTLLILSNIDGLFNGSPKDPASSVIPEVGPDEDLSGYIHTEKSGFGRGGMMTKCAIARKVADEGIRVIIANGRKDNIITDIFSGSDTAVTRTEFAPRHAGVSSVKKWIAHSTGFTKGQVTVNQNAEKALKGKKAVSLLPVGITDVAGDFDEGDIISILGPDGHQFAVGRSSYNSEEARSVIGHHDCRPLVHYDYLSLI